MITPEEFNREQQELLERNLRILTATELEELNQRATQGYWGQFSGSYGPFKEEAREVDYTVWDTSHGVSAMAYYGRKKVASFTHSNDASFAEELVNLYRLGKLKYVEE